MNRNRKARNNERENEARGGIKMKNKKIGITLISLGVLAAQSFTTPTLLASNLTDHLSDKSEDASQSTFSKERKQSNIDLQEPNIELVSSMRQASNVTSNIAMSTSSKTELSSGYVPIIEESSESPDESTDFPEESHWEDEELGEENSEEQESDKPEESQQPDIPIEETIPSEVPEAEQTVPPSSEAPVQPDPPTSSINQEDQSSDSGANPFPPSAPVTRPPATDQEIDTIFEGLLNSAENQLPDAFRSSEVAESTLGSFTLPLLASFDHSWQAALVYQTIRQVGADDLESKEVDTWLKELYNEVLATNLENLDMKESTYNSLQPGDILYKETAEGNQLLGIWLGNDYYGTIGTQEMSETLEQESQEDEVNEDVDLNQSATSVVYLEKLSYQQVDQEEWDEENISLLIKRAQSPELTEVGKELVKNYPAQLDFQFNTATHEFIKQISEKARKLGQEYDVFASVLIAQAILESGNGSSLLSKAPYYNLFGIKGSYREGAVVMTTKEDLGNGEMIEIQDAFRVYPSYDESLTDYIALIRGGVSHDSFFYKSVWRSEAKNYLRATDALTGTYATDTSYNQKLNSLIAVYELTQYDEDQSQQSGVFIKGLEEVPNEYRELMTFPAYNGKDYNTSGSYPVGQCTWYAFNRVAQLGGRVDDYMGNGGDWGTTGLRLGYQVSRTPKAGTLISFSHGTAGSDPRYGHVAFVEAVGPNGILISEANVYGGTTISYRVIGNDLARSSLVQYITPK